MGPRTILVAADKFKGSLTSGEVSSIIADVVRDHGCVARAVPVADGGDGTLDAVEAAGFRPVPVTVAGPTGEPVASRFCVRGDTAVVELADACGLLRLPGGRLQPLTASSLGLGEAMRAALADESVERLVVGVGGSASTDGGAGMLVGLGAILRDHAGSVLEPSALGLARVASLDLGALESRIRDRTIVLASDVTNPLLGPMGTVAVFGPQKGLVGPEAAETESALGSWARVVSGQCGRDERDVPGAGSAGGVGFAALTVLRARMRPGLEVVLELGDFASERAQADSVITGEGSLDEQSLMGKVVAGVSAAAAPVPTVAVCGRSTLTAQQARSIGLAGVYPLSDLEPDPDRSMKRAASLLRSTVQRILREWT